jgi:hypothetical protein
LKSHFSAGNVAHVTFRQPRFSDHHTAIALASSQKSNIANFVTPPTFLGHPFFSANFAKNVEKPLPHPPDRWLHSKTTKSMSDQKGSAIPYGTA